MEDVAKPLAKVEAKRQSTWDAIYELEAEATHNTDADFDAPVRAHLDACIEHVEAERAARTAVEERREELRDARFEDKLAARDRALELCDELDAELRAIDQANRAASVLADKNPAKLVSAKPYRENTPGDRQLAKIRDTLENLDVPDRIIVDGPNLAALQRGAPARDIFGADITGTPARRVVLSHSPRKLIEVEP
jgi:hypothetical protein